MEFYCTTILQTPSSVSFSVTRMLNKTASTRITLVCNKVIANNSSERLKRWLNECVCMHFTQANFVCRSMHKHLLLIYTYLHLHVVRVHVWSCVHTYECILDYIGVLYTCAHVCLKATARVCARQKILSVLSLLAAVGRQSRGAESHYRTSQLPPTRSDAVHSLSHTPAQMCVREREKDTKSER